MKHLAIYLRVSSRQQDTAAQEPDLKRWAESQSEPVVWYTDKASGLTMDRKAWNRLASDIGMGAVSSVVVWRLDRLGRTAKGLTALFDELTQRKVNLVSLREGIDLQTPAGRLMANVLASVAQFETEVRRERTAAGIAAARAKGRRWGGSKKGRAMRTRATDEQQAMITELAGRGEKIARIARAVGLSRQTVYQYLPQTAA